MKAASILLLVSMAISSHACANPVTPDLRRSGHLGGEGVDGVSLSIDRQQYQIGDSIRVQLSNSGREPIGYNGCHMSRDFLVEGEWRRIESLRICTAAFDTLGPAETTLLTEEVSSDWQSGSYRLVLTVPKLISGTDLLLYSPIFEVER